MTASTAGDGPFVGRARELRELLDGLEAAMRGHGGVQLVLGEPGVGKTRLAAALAEHATRAGATVVWTRGWGRAAPAYWPWAEVVRALCRDRDGATLRAALGPAGAQLLRLAPELAERLALEPPPAAAGEDPEIARFALFDALVVLLRATSSSAPLVVLVDDLQAVDEGSLVALDFVSRMLRDAAVLLVVTMHERVPEQSPDAQLAMTNIVRAGRRLVLGGLTRADVAQLVELSSGAPAPAALVDAVHVATEGNPLFAREIIALLLAEGRLDDPPATLPLPEGVRETIRRRLVPLGEDAVTTLGLAAIVGRTFSLHALERASALDRDDVLAALDAATRLGLVVPIAGQLGHYRFGHGLIAETLLAGMPAAERMAGHRAVGEALEHVYRGAIEAHLAELAHHFLSAAPRGDLGKAVDYAQRAAERTLDNLAYEQAADLYARALEAHERLELDVARRAALLLGLGTALARTGRPQARDTFAAAAAAARSIDAADVLAQAALGFAPFALTPGYVDEVHVRLLGEALDGVGAADDALRVRLLGALAVALYWSPAEQRRLELSDEALQMARRLGDDATIAFALSSAQLACSAPERTPEGLELLEELFALTERSGETSITLAARSRHIDLLLELDDLAASDIAIETLERLAHDARDRRAAAFVPLHRARRAALEGRFDDARALLAGVAALAAELSATTIPLTVAATNVVLIWQQQGPREILDHVRAYADGAPAMPAWRAGLAAALAAAGRRDEALLELDRLAAGDYAVLPRDNLWLCALALLTETVSALELPERAGELHAMLAPFAGRNIVLPTSGGLGPVDMWLGILARVARRPDAALEHLAAARASATRNGARASLARIALEEAATLAEVGTPAACACARELLATAAADCERLALGAMLERVGPLRARLERAAPAPAPAAPPAPTAETPTLRRVGGVWTIEAGERTLHITDGRGMRLLAQLLARPGQELHSLDLVAAVDGAAPPDRGSGSHAERARVNVTRAIRSTLKRIAAYDAQLGRELQDAVRTGTFCSYAPEPGRSRRWRVDERPG